MILFWGLEERVHNYQFLLTLIKKQNCEIKPNLSPHPPVLEQAWLQAEWLFMYPKLTQTSCSPPATGNIHWQLFGFQTTFLQVPHLTLLSLSSASPWEVFSILRSQITDYCHLFA